jgi:hypothetical protein
MRLLSQFQPCLSRAPEGEGICKFDTITANLQLASCEFSAEGKLSQTDGHAEATGVSSTGEERVAARNWYLCAASAFSMVTGSAAHARSSSAATPHAPAVSDNVRGDIVGTARNRAENRQKTSVAISALGGVANDPRVYRIDLVKHFLGAVLADLPSASSTRSMRVTI